MTHPVLETIKSRRVVRSFTDKIVERDKLERILEAGRWAPAGGNQRVNRFVAIQNPETLKLLRLVSPGMSHRPTAAIVICLDSNKKERYPMGASERVVSIDVGTAMQTMMLAAHALGVDSGPVTSFPKEAVRVVLNLPNHLSPEVILCLGHKAEKTQAPMISPEREKVTWQSMTDWERFAD